MRITRIELDNIKSYRHAAISLREGTTAIRGQNGAGKSTLVEAIGFALFDAMNYNQAQFVREGEKYGQVAVSFLSALDDREYQVVRRCGSSPVWYVYDPDMQSRLVEQRADVLAFLRQHLRIEGEVALDALFTDALGVTQGTFTADFLLTPTQRKKKFDALLQVEDYRKAAEKLNETRAYLQEQRREQEQRIAALERETARLPAAREELAAQRSLATALTARLETIQREAGAIEVQREALRRAEAEVSRLASASELAAATLRAAHTAEERARALHEEARAADAICATTRAAHAAYLAAESALSAVRARERTRNALLAQRSAIAQRLEGENNERKHAERRLVEAATAAQRVVDLQPATERQRDLEARLQEARLRAEQLDDARQRLTGLLAQRAQATRESTTIEQRILALEALRSEAERLPTLRAELEALQAAEVGRVQREQRLRALQAEQPTLQRSCQQMSNQVAKLSESVRKIRAQQAVAEDLPAREAAHVAADQAVRRIEARQEHHRLSRQQSGQGNCPFLSEPCLNMRQRGENSLAHYFDRLLEEDDALLLPARQQREAAEAALRQAQTVRTYFDRLAEYEERHRADAQLLAEYEERARQQAAEAATLARELALAPSAQALKTARDAAHRAEAAHHQMATLPPLQQQFDGCAARLAQLSGEVAQLEERVAVLMTAHDAVAQLNAALTDLDDPRAKSATQELIARERPHLEAALAKAQAQATQLAAELAQLDDALRPFAGLDDELRQLDSEVARTRTDHARYLRYEQSASRLADLAGALAEATRECARARAAAEAASQAYETARQHFDPAVLLALGERITALGAERGQKTAELKHAHDAATHLDSEIARLEQMEREELTLARDERQTLDELEKMLQQFRETIKEAGPYIMRALLRQISVEANRLFGEIMGDRSAQLSWEQDYEVILRRDGRERGFALLSGGEQMSAALAVRLALLRTLSRLDIAFFDEPTQNMDGQRRGNLAEQIRRIRGFEQLIVISHDDTFEQGLDSVIYLEKRDGETLCVDAETAMLAV